MKWRVDVDDGKYSIVFYDDGGLYCLRHGLQWIENPPASKMLIAIGHELEALRKVAASAKVVIAQRDACAMRIEAMDDLAAALRQLEA